MDKPSGIDQIRQRAELAGGAAAPGSAAATAKAAVPAGFSAIFRVAWPLLVLIAGIEFLDWVHWNSLAEVAQQWSNPKYSHGYLIPLFAVVLLYLRRDESTPLLPALTNIGLGLMGVGLLLCLLPFVTDRLDYLGPVWGPPLFIAVGVGLAVAGAVLFVQERIGITDVPIRDRWIGLAIVAGAELIRIWAGRNFRSSPDWYSYVPALIGVFVLVGGLRILKWAGLPLLFLAFMCPLPKQLDAQSANLQTVAAKASTYLLQTIGMQASRDGNKIMVGSAETPLNVAEACSGLRMLTIFGALSFAVALLLTHRPMWERIVIVLSSVPIALAVNILRIVATGLLFVVFPASQESLRKWAHDTAGWVMMPLALGLMFLEMQLLQRVFLEEDEDAPVNPPVGAAIPPRPATVTAGAPPVRSAAPPVRTAAPPPRTAAPPPRTAAPPARTAVPPARTAAPPPRPAAAPASGGIPPKRPAPPPPSGGRPPSPPPPQRPKQT